MLGELIHTALSQVGVTPEVVSRWLGRPCDCQDRRDRLNALTVWARRVAAGKVADADGWLRRLLGV